MIIKMIVGILVADISRKGGIEIVSMRLIEEFKSCNIQAKLYSLRNEKNTTVDNVNLNVVNMNKDVFRICQSINDDSITHLVVQLNGPFGDITNIKLYENILSHNIKVYVVLHNSPLSFIKRYRDIFIDSIPVYIMKKIKTMLIYSQMAKNNFYKLNRLHIPFITLSHGNYAELKKYYGIESHIIYNSVPKHKNNYLQNNTVKNNQVVYLGRLVDKTKGLTFLFNSWKKIKKRGWELWIVGEGPDEENLKNYVCKKKIESVVFVNWQDSENVNSIFGFSKVMALTSAYEGFPTVFYEALINNVVVICTKFDGFSDELIKNHTNALVCKRNTKVFSSNLQRLIDEPQLIEQLVKNTPSILAEYAKTDSVTQWLKLFELENNN